MILWALYGGIAGVAFGVAIGFLLAPTREPGQPLRHEWYMMAIMSYAFWSAVGGAILGSILGAFPKPKTFWVALVGMVIGGMLGYLVWKNGPIPPDHAYTGHTIIWITFASAILGGVIGAIWSVVGRTHCPSTTFKNLLHDRPSRLT